MSKNHINWRLQFVELIVVILGISIAFSIDEWQEKRKQQKQVVAALESFKADLDGDISILDRFMIEYNEDKAHLMNLLIANIKSNNFKGDSLQEAFIQFANSASTVINNTAFEAAKTSGVFSYFSNEDLKNDIIRHYYVNTNQVKFLSGIEDDLSDDLDHYLTHNFPTQFHLEETLPNVLEDMTFQNYLMRYHQHINWKIREYRRIKDQSAELVKKIDDELSR